MNSSLYMLCAVVLVMAVIVIYALLSRYIKNKSERMAEAIVNRKKQSDNYHKSTAYKLLNEAKSVEVQLEFSKKVSEIVDKVLQQASYKAKHGEVTLILKFKKDDMRLTENVLAKLRDYDFNIYSHTSDSSDLNQFVLNWNDTPANIF